MPALLRGTLAVSDDTEITLSGKARAREEKCSSSSEKQQSSPGRMSFEIAPLSLPGFVISSALACTKHYTRGSKRLVLSFFLVLQNAFVLGVAISFPSAL